MALRDGTCGVPARVCDQTIEQYTRMREETMNKRTISAKSFRLVESFLVRNLTAVLRAIAKPTSLAVTPARRPQTFQTLDSGRASTHYLRVSRLLAVSLESTFSSSVAASCPVPSYLVRRAPTLLPTSLSSPFRCASPREKQHEFLPCLADPPLTNHHSTLS